MIVRAAGAGEPLEVTVAGVSFRLAPRGSVAADLLKGLTYEPREVELVLSRLPAGGTFLDVGSNAGLFALAAAKLSPLNRVYAIEPAAWTFELLRENLRLNDVRNVVAVQAALGDRLGHATLQINAAGKDGLNTIGDPVHPDSEVTACETVPLTTLDAFVAAHTLDRVDALKVDVEGAELLVFRGGERLLRRGRAPVILYESLGFNTTGFGYEPVAIARLLSDFGYATFALDRATGHLTPCAADDCPEGTIVALQPDR